MLLQSCWWGVVLAVSRVAALLLCAVVVACGHRRAVVVAYHRRPSLCRIVAGFCRCCVVSSSSIVVIVSRRHLLVVVGQVRWVGTEVLTNGWRRMTNLSSYKVNCCQFQWWEGRMNERLWFGFPWEVNMKSRGIGVLMDLETFLIQN